MIEEATTTKEANEFFSTGSLIVASSVTASPLLQHNTHLHSAHAGARSETCAAARNCEMNASPRDDARIRTSGRLK